MHIQSHNILRTWLVHRGWDERFNLTWAVGRNLFLFGLLFWMRRSAFIEVVKRRHLKSWLLQRLWRATINHSILNLLLVTPNYFTFYIEWFIFNFNFFFCYRFRIWFPTLAWFLGLFWFLWMHIWIVLGSHFLTLYLVDRITCPLHIIRFIVGEKECILVTWFVCLQL